MIVDVPKRTARGRALMRRTDAGTAASVCVLLWWLLS